MIRRKRLMLLAAALTLTPVGLAQEAPGKVGQCVTTTVTSVGTRLGAAGTGSVISFANGVRQISYQTVASIDHSKPGDTVKLCLVQLPKNCPAGDDRGKVYTGQNQRTHESWRESDSEHACGG